MNLISTRGRSARSGASGEGVAADGLAMRLRVLTVAAFGPPITAYAAVAAVFALVSAIAAHAGFAPLGTLLAAGPGLLAVYQVPVEIGQSPLGVLPLLPTIGVCLLVARTAGSAAQRLGYREPGQAVVLVGVISAVHALMGALIAVLSGGEPFRAEPLNALLIMGLLSAASALVGVAGRCGISSALRRHLNDIALSGLRAGALGMAALITTGAVTFAISMFSALSTVHDLFVGSAPGFGGGLGLLLLSLGYLPNAVLAGTAVATGAGFSIGGLSISPLAFTAGPLPGVPLLAAVPESYAGWWSLLLLLPALSGCLVGWYLRAAAEQPRERLRAVVIAGVVVALGALLAAPLSGGELGDGMLDAVQIPAGMLSIAAFCWIVVPAGLVSWFTGPRPAPDPEETFEEDEEDDFPELLEDEDGEVTEPVDVDHDEPEWDDPDLDEVDDLELDDPELEEVDDEEFESAEELDEELPAPEESERGLH